MVKHDIDTESLTTLIDETGIEAVAEMIGIFADETARRLPRMRASRQAADWQALAYDAHALVSSAAQFGGRAVSRAAFQLEQRVRQGDLAEAEEIYTALIMKIDAFMAALQHFRTRLIC